MRSSASVTSERLWGRLLSALLFVAPAHQLAASHAASSPGKTFVYELRYGYARRGPLHTADLALVFGTWEAVGNSLLGFPEDAGQVSAVLMDAWTRFARTGSPATVT